jgi:hypothetical protein
MGMTDSDLPSAVDLGKFIDFVYALKEERDQLRSSIAASVRTQYDAQSPTPCVFMDRADIDELLNGARNSIITPVYKSGSLLTALYMHDDMREVDCSEKHRNDMADLIVAQRTEINALRAQLAELEARISLKDAGINHRDVLLQEVWDSPESHQYMSEEWHGRMLALAGDVE